MKDSDNNNSNNKNNESRREDQPQLPSRRAVLKRAGLVGAGTLGGAVMPGVTAQPAAPAALEALEVLTAAEADVLEAICDRLIPSDEHGPGARQARAAHYIDRSLASHNSGDRDAYMVGLNALNDYALRTRRKHFAGLSRDAQESILLALQRNRIPDFPLSGSGFFNMLRNHTIDGTFCDPYYGGNRRFVGWDMIGYPGVRQGVSDSEVRLGRALGPNHRSAYDYANYTKTGGGEPGDA